MARNQNPRHEFQLWLERFPFFLMRSVAKLLPALSNLSIGICYYPNQSLFLAAQFQMKLQNVPE
jgi:hypothetical protein